MQEAKEMREMLTLEFSEHYMEKLFYFCLKKTGNHNEAEDLTQDIALHIITALNKGTVPTSFSAWTWQIARNRYSIWAKEKHNRRNSVTGADIGDYSISDESENLIDTVIQKEQIALLRREMAFIKSDYRNIVVAYYIDNKSIREIAASLSLPTNTVKSKLFRAREFLKEGMNMAREFGKRSYRPEDVRFASSGPQPSGLPFRAVQRTVPKNILLEASNNPSTIEELSIELGIALPYMEEEVELLHRATLLEKQGDKYITNFFIADKECCMEIYRALRGESAERSTLIREFMDGKLADIRALGIAGEHIEDNSIRWWLIPHIIDELIEQAVKDKGAYNPPKRANGETWGFIGHEIVELPETTDMGHNGINDAKNEFWTRKYSDYSMWDQCGEPTYEEAMLLCDCIRNKRLTSSFTAMETRIWNGIEGKYAHATENGEIISDILVMNIEQYRQINQLLSGHATYAPLLQNVARAYEKIEKIFKKYSHKVLHDSIGYNIRMEMCAMRMMAVHDLVSADVLKLPKDPKKSSLGMNIVLH